MKIIKNNLKYVIYSLITNFSVYKYFFLNFSNKWAYILDIMLLILLFIFYKKLSNNIKLDKKYRVFIIVMSFIFVLGYSYQITSTGELFWGSILNLLVSIIKILGYYLFFKVLIYYIVKFMQKDYVVNNKIIKKFSEHPFLYSFIFLSICYGIFLVFYYPGIINYDNANQIKEMLGFHTRYLDAINPISSSALTNFNPILHTVLLGGMFKIGLLLGNANFGLFMYSLFQMLIVILIYSYAVSYSIKEKISPIYSFIILLILGLVPIFGYYSITAVKDTLYTAFLVLFSIEIYDFIKKEKLNNHDFINLFLVSMLVILFRNNGLYIVIFTIPFLLYKKEKIAIIGVLALIIMSYASFNNVFLPSVGISGTSIRETLSIPFQQTARLVKIHGNKVSDEDRKVIDKILDYENLAKDYNEDLADPVKNKYNKDAEMKDLMEYFGVWFKGLVKYPLLYVDATINNITSYFYPFESSWKVYHKLNPKLPLVGIDYHYNSLDKAREFMHDYEVFSEYSPVGIILNIGVITWTSILVFIMLCKNKYYIFLIPNIISILFCVLSPANTYYRYIYPSLLIMICLFPIIKKLSEKKS
ncbi:MAG: hypothetical protein IJY87_00480 [Bacilli bacterium]|nr:hypothetical protein [Bacilli bacterium]